MAMTITTPHLTDDCGLPDPFADALARRSPQEYVTFLNLLNTPGLMTHCAYLLGDAAAEKVLCYLSRLRAEMAGSERISVALSEVLYRRLRDSG